MSNQDGGEGRGSLPEGGSYCQRTFPPMIGCDPGSRPLTREGEVRGVAEEKNVLQRHADVRWHSG